MKESQDTEQLFYHQIRILLNAEKMLTEAMPLMIKKAKHPGLKLSLAHHLAETDQHKVALELICKQLGIELEGDLNQDLKGILEEGEKVMSEGTAGKALDAAIIASAKNVEQYEISEYRIAAHSAEMLGHKGIASRLRLTLEEEQQADTKLSFMAKELVYPQAQMATAESRP